MMTEYYRREEIPDEVTSLKSIAYQLRCLYISSIRSPLRIVSDYQYRMNHSKISKQNQKILKGRNPVLALSLMT